MSVSAMLNENELFKRSLQALSHTSIKFVAYDIRVPNNTCTVQLTKNRYSLFPYKNGQF